MIDNDLQTLEPAADSSSESNSISEISKSGYQFLKENKTSEAIDCFSKILLMDEQNNYALV